MPEPPSASIVIPTRARPGYLEVTLASVAPQAASCGAEVIVVSDGEDAASAAVARRHGAALVELPQRAGANAARNAGIAAAGSELIVLIDDDVEAPPGWLAALLLAVAADREQRYEVFGGPITARLEGGGPRSCGREPPPITTLDLGPEDRDTELVWSANMALRRQALMRVGPFDERLEIRGDEEDWEQRHLAAGGLTRYVAGAGLTHRRTPLDARLRSLVRAAWHQGRAARRYDVFKGRSRASWHELRLLAGCLWHIGRRRCLNGVVLSAHALGRLREALGPVAPPPPPEDFLSGMSGGVSGVRATTRAVLTDAALDALAAVRLERPRLARAAPAVARRRVLALALERPDEVNLLAEGRRELLRSRHWVDFHAEPVGEAGKFENLDRMLAAHDIASYDWLLVLDDDVSLPRGFLDAFLLLCERFELAVAAPAHRRRSNAAWPVTRRQARSLVRETAFVEIGPVFAFARPAFEALLPFPPLRAGWGLELHWAALARERGLRQGIVDATPITHRVRPIAAGYDRGAAVAEAREFLAAHPYLPAAQAARTLAVHRSLPT